MEILINVILTLALLTFLAGQIILVQENPKTSNICILITYSMALFGKALYVFFLR